MACIQWSESNIFKFDKQLISEFWSLDTTTKKTDNQIKKEAKIVNFAITLNTLFGLFTGLVLIPTGKEQESHFFLYFSRKYLFCHYLFDVVYFLGFPIVSFTIVSLANSLAYYTCHTRFQIRLALDLNLYLSKEYEDILDDVLFQNVEYQKIIKKRLAFLVERHCVLYRQILCRRFYRIKKTCF